MNTKYRIAIIGMGGVGGFIGAKLADFYKASSDVEIIFLARGDNEKTIQQQGLKLVTPEKEIIAHPALVTADPETIGKVDLFICCVKAYHLEQTVRSLEPCIKENSVFLPILNGINATETIAGIYPGTTVLEGCIYLISQLTAPGIVQQSGAIDHLYFGKNQEVNKEFIQIENILRDAGLHATLSDHIREICWEKFFFISTLASVTSYLDMPIGKILANKDSRDVLMELLKELHEVAGKCAIKLPADIMEKTLEKMSKLPPEATSSMQRDFKNGNSTELETITGHVLLLAKKHQVNIPVYTRLYEALSGK